MAPTVNQGVRGTGILGTETRRVRDVTAALAQLEPDAGPLITLLTRLRSRAATDPKVEWFEDELLPDQDILAADMTSVALTMTVTNYKYFRKGDLVKVANAEVVRVTATPTTTTVAIKRAVGETAAAAVTADASKAQLFIMSDSSEEGAAGRDIITTQKSPIYNYLQIIRTPVGFTETAMGTKTFAGEDKMTERNKALLEHKKRIEKAILFGERGEDTSGTHPQRNTRGVIKFISTNVKDVSASGLTEPEFEDFLRVVFRYGSKEKVLMCSPKVITLLNQFGRSKLMTKTDESTYGITMTEYKNAGRRLMLVEHNLLTNMALNDLSGVAGFGILLDIMDLELRYLKGRMTVLKENIQANDIDGEQDEYLSEVGLELHQEKKHGLLTGAIA